MKVLAGDIGGTKTALASVDISEKKAVVRGLRIYHSRDYESLEAILADFLAGAKWQPAAAGFGVAGPVVAGRSRITKLPWIVDERAVSKSTGIPAVRVVNDFVAAALGVPYVGPRHTRVLQKGRPEPGGTIGLIGAGTGLGQAVLVREGRGWRAVASEGGHADFGPRNDVEDRLVRFVRKQFGRVDRDRLLSGEGLTHIYDFFKSEGKIRESARLTRAFEEPGADRAAVISRFGLAGERLAKSALRLFVSIYGSEAGNLALQYRATGGVFLSGGLAPKILPALQDPVFLESFRSKPPLEALLARIPVRVVRELRLPLFGAAAAAYSTETAIFTTRPSS